MKAKKVPTDYLAYFFKDCVEEFAGCQFEIFEGIQARRIEVFG
jgi:hypothetical protein